MKTQHQNHVVPAPAPEETTRPTYKADIEVPATETAFGRLVHVDLDADETAAAALIADKLGMKLTAFVRAVASNSLPGQQ